MGEKIWWHKRKVISLGKFFCICLVLWNTNAFSQPLASGYNKFLGNGTGASIPSSFDSYWNQVTPGNEGKWGSVETSRNIYDWVGLDQIYNYAIQRGLVYKHHNLIWGQQQPDWISSLDSASQRTAVKAWIDSVGRRYPKMDFIDVVNEPFNAPPNGRNGTANYIQFL